MGLKALILSTLEKAGRVQLAEKALGRQKQRTGHRHIEVSKSSQEEVRSHADPLLTLTSVREPGPCDRPGTARRHAGIAKQAGPERGRPGAYRAGWGRCEERGGLSHGSGFTTHPSGRDLSYCPSGTYDHWYGGGELTVQSTTGHCVPVMVLPYKATESDICDFFSPLSPVRAHIETGPDGRVTGRADVDFAAHEAAVVAVSKDRATMQHRYTELLLNSTTGASKGAYGSQMTQGMGVSTQSSSSGLESQSSPN
ncbi:heterogeneous nuclear ribonucleoprotein F-like protein [Camelus ferus]|nr:heterogeneous nuclear ribonucleoprotein F-like protein [Camelus ferus]